MVTEPCKRLNNEKFKLIVLRKEETQERKKTRPVLNITCIPFVKICSAFFKS